MKDIIHQPFIHCVGLSSIKDTHCLIVVVSRVDYAVVLIRINVSFEDSARGKSFTRSISFELGCYYLEYAYVDF